VRPRTSDRCHPPADRLLTGWGIPDWTSATAYGDTTRWSENKWRWEFTRRREDYRADFDRNLPETLAELAERSRAEPGQQFLRPDQPGFVAQGYVDLTHKYGLGGLPNPRISDQPFYVLIFRSEGAQYTVGYGHNRWAQDVATARVPDGFGAVLFDLRQPIDRQWQRIRETVLHFQKIKFGGVVQSRRRPEKRLGYLRVIDARETGATWRQIAENGALGRNRRSQVDRTQGPQTARQVWEQARHLMFNWPN
jgi:hypothetical protein